MRSTRALPGSALWLACALAACSPQSAPPAPIVGEGHELPEDGEVDTDGGTSPGNDQPGETSVVAMQQKLKQACEEISPDDIYMTVSSFGRYTTGLDAVSGLVDVSNPGVGLPCFNGGSGGAVIGYDGALMVRDSKSKTQIRTLVADIPAWSATMKRWAPSSTPEANDVFTEVADGRCELSGELYPFPDRPGVLARCVDPEGVVHWIDSETLDEIRLPSLDRPPPVGPALLLAVGPAGLTLWFADRKLTLAQDDRVVAEPKLGSGVTRATADGFLVVSGGSLYSLSSTGEATLLGAYTPDEHWISGEVSAMLEGDVALDPAGALYMRGGGAQNKVWRYLLDGQPASEIWAASYAVHDESGGGWFPANRSGIMLTGASGAH